MQCLWRYFYKLLLLELPLLPAHGALVLGLLRAQPLHDAVDVEAVAALSPHKRTVVSSKLTVRAAAVKSYPTDTTGIIIGQPLPDSDTIPGADVDP